MSLNKFSESSIKDYINIGANELKCNSLSVAGVPFNPAIPPTIQAGLYTPTTLDLGVTVVSVVQKNFRYTYVNGICNIAAQLNFDTGSNNIGTLAVIYFSIPSGMSIVADTKINNNGILSCNGGVGSLPLYIPILPSNIAPDGNTVIETGFATTNTSVAQINGVINISLNVTFSATLD